MSGFVSVVATGFSQIEASHSEHADGYYFQGHDLVPNVTISADLWWDEEDAAGFASPWWPKRGGMLGLNDTQDNVITRSAWWGEVWGSAGAPSQMVFTGYTRDVYGSILPACIVKCFRTADHTLQSFTTSDANGLYWLSTPYVEAHYLVVHKAGSPEVAGATVSSLLPA